MSRAVHPERGEIYQAKKNLEIRVLEVYARNCSVQLLIGGEPHGAPFQVTRLQLEQLFFGPVRYAA